MYIEKENQNISTPQTSHLSSSDLVLHRCDYVLSPFVAYRRLSSPIVAYRRLSSPIVAYRRLSSPFVAFRRAPSLLVALRRLSPSQVGFTPESSTSLLLPIFHFTSSTVEERVDLSSHHIVCSLIPLQAYQRIPE